MKLSSLRIALPFAASLMLSPVFVRADDAPPPGPPPPQDQGDQPDQGARPHGRRGDRMLQDLKAKLSLTDAQVQQAKGIAKATMQQMRAIREDDSLSDDDRRAKMMAVRQSMRSQIRAILTADQQKIFDSLPPPPMRRGGPPADGDGPPPGTPPT